MTVLQESRHDDVLRVALGAWYNSPSRLVNCWATMQEDLWLCWLSGVCAGCSKDLIYWAPLISIWRLVIQCLGALGGCGQNPLLSELSTCVRMGGLLKLFLLGRGLTDATILIGVRGFPIWPNTYKARFYEHFGVSAPTFCCNPSWCADSWSAKARHPWGTLGGHQWKSEEASCWWTLLVSIPTHYAKSTQDSYTRERLRLWVLILVTWILTRFHTIVILIIVTIVGMFFNRDFPCCFFFLHYVPLDLRWSLDVARHWIIQYL